MPKYAEGTMVPVLQSKNEIERLIRSKGGINVSFGGEEDAAIPYSWARFKLRGYVLRFKLYHPTADDPAIALDGRGYRRTATQIRTAVGQEERRRWRELVLLLKAKLISLDSPVVSFEQEFLSYIVLDDDQTVGDLAIPRLQELQQKQLTPGDVRARVIALPAPRAEA